jgi:hypothetical protein
MMEKERMFHKAMLSIYESAKNKCGYTATRFMQMLSRYGGVETAKRLLGSDDTQYGFTELYLCGRLDLTVEAHVLKPEFKSLFSEEHRRRAKERLEAHGYPC